MSRTASPGEGRSSSSLVNLSDSALLVGAAQRLYNGGVGSLTFGGVTTDPANTGRGGRSELFLHQAFLDHQARSHEEYLGRTDQPTAQLVTFPTLRGEDLITFTHVLNPFSDGENDEEHRYSNIASATFNRKLTQFVNVHAQHLLNTAALGDGGGLNSYGFMYQYLSPPGLEEIQRVISYGAGFESRSVGKSNGGRSNALYAGGVVNLRRSLVRRIDFRVLGVHTFGNDLGAFRDLTDTFRANSNSVAASLRYLKTPFGVPGMQLALTGGYKTYPKVSNASSYGLALTGVKRLGEGFDLVGQLKYEHRNGALAAAYDGERNQQAVQVGFIFNFDSLFNRHIGPRRSLLNLQHQYIPNF
jgi:hypothetical protein